MDVHKEAIVIAVLNGSGKLVMEAILEIKASIILQFIHGLRGAPGDLARRNLGGVADCCSRRCSKSKLVCNPRRNALLKEGSKSDKVDARMLAELRAAIRPSLNNFRVVCDERGIHRRTAQTS